MDDIGGYIIMPKHRLDVISDELMNIYTLLETIRDKRELPKCDTISALRILHEAVYRIYVLIFVRDKYLEYEFRAYEANSKFQQFINNMLGGSETIV